MATHAENPGTVNQVEDGQTWANTSNALGAADASEASVTGITSETSSKTLELSNFGFALGSGETVVGMKITVRARCDTEFGGGEIAVTINKALAGGEG